MKFAIDIFEIKSDLPIVNGEETTTASKIKTYNVVSARDNLAVVIRPLK